MCLITTSSNEWPHGDIQPYVPEFIDGWQPPQLSAAPKPKAPLSRVEALQPASSRVSRDRQSDLGTEGKGLIFVVFSSTLMQKSAKWKPSPPPQEPGYAQSKAHTQSLNASDALPCSTSPVTPQYMRVMHDFASRNSKELTIRKGEIVEASVQETKRCVHAAT